MKRQRKERSVNDVEPIRFRLDPAELPLRFVASDATAEGKQRIVTLRRDRVVMSRELAGMAMKIVVPIKAYRGVAARVFSGATPAEDRLGVVLLHRDRALDVPLCEAGDDREAAIEWRRWAEALDLPLLIECADGRIETPDGSPERPAPPMPRRQGSLVRRRRARFLTRRRTTKLRLVPLVHRDEDELFPAV